MNDLVQYERFLNCVINAGIAAARADYVKPEDATRLRGSVAGFEACRGKDVLSLARILAEARQRGQGAFFDHAAEHDAYWEIRCFEAEVEWVCNVVSAALVNQGATPIIPPTARGVLAAARYLAEAA